MKPEDIKELIIDIEAEHKWIWGLCIRYIEFVLSKWKSEDIEYEKYIIPFIENVEKMLVEYIKFEEENVFPIIEDRELVSKLVDEHRYIEKLVEEIKDKKKLDAIKSLPEEMKSHLQLENNRLIRELKKLS